MKTGLRLCAIGLSTVGFAAAALDAEPIPKRGGTLTFTIPADAPPSFDGHREDAFATLHATAPFYSVLIRINPQNPSLWVSSVGAEQRRAQQTWKTPSFRAPPQAGARNPYSRDL